MLCFFDNIKWCLVIQMVGNDNTQCHLGQSKDWIFCEFLVTCTCNVWRNKLCCICWSIRRHFKCSVDTLILNKSYNFTCLFFSSPKFNAEWNGPPACQWVSRPVVDADCQRSHAFYTLTECQRGNGGRFPAGHGGTVQWEVDISWEVRYEVLLIILLVNSSALLYLWCVFYEKFIQSSQIESFSASSWGIVILISSYINIIFLSWV